MTVGCMVGRLIGAWPERYAVLPADAPGLHPILRAGACGRSAHVVAMDNPQRPPTPPDRDNDHEPVARWENEGGAYDERDAQARPGPAITRLMSLPTRTTPARTASSSRPAR
jgi:hypothetical protein